MIIIGVCRISMCLSTPFWWRVRVEVQHFIEMSFLFGSSSSYLRLVTHRIPGDLRTSRDGGSVAVSHAAGQKTSHCTY